MFTAYLFRFIFRALIFIAAIVVYFISPESLSIPKSFVPINSHWYLYATWLILFIDIFVRFFPRRLVSIGSLKQFKQFYDSAPEPLHFDHAEKTKLKMDHGALKVALVWILLNSVVYYLYFTGIIGSAEMLLITLFYYVSDLICIVFFCPFRKFLMKNRCCVSCRIFNWDAIMMCTPLFPVISVFSWTLCISATALFLVWELRWRKNPEFFMPLTNKRLRCENCTEKLCKFKRMVQKDTYIV